MITDQEKFWDYLKNGHEPPRLKIYGQPPIGLGHMDPTIRKQLAQFFMKNMKSAKACGLVRERKQ